MHSNANGHGNSNPNTLMLHHSVRSGIMHFLLLISGVATAAAASQWPEVEPAVFTENAPQVDPEAGAEVLLREVVIDDTPLEATYLRHHIRIRIYNDRGVDRVSKIDIPFDGDTSINDIEARTVKPDGTVVELDNKDIFTREIVRSGNVRRKVKSFSLPGLEPGVVVDYRYREVHFSKTYVLPMPFQGDLPARVVRYRLLPLNLSEYLPGMTLRCLFFRMPQQPLKPESDGYYSFEATNLPAWKDEPFQTALLQLQSNIIAYYTLEKKAKPAAFWAKQAARLHLRAEVEAKVTPALRKALGRIVVDGDTEEEKLRKIHDFCRTKIVNRNRGSSGYTREQRRKLPPNKDATDTLKHGNGTAVHINVLFTALARAAGFDARLALCNDRTWIPYTASSMMEAFIFPKLVAAVQQDGKWTYFDPGATYMPAGMLEWKYAETAALVASPKAGVIQKVDGMPAEATTTHRVAKFVLGADGTLEGDVKVTFSGYEEAREKNAFDEATPDERAKRVRDEIRKTLELAEVTDIIVENASDPLQPLEVKYHLRVPEFAERTGSRIFLQPSVFRKGTMPMFEATTRRSTVVFNHRYVETDEVAITLPEGFEIEAGSAPGEMPLGNLGSYKTKITYASGTRTLRYRRDFALRGMGVSQANYMTLKQTFDAVHARDNHMLTLTRKAAALGETATAPGTQ